MEKLNDVIKNIPEEVLENFETFMDKFYSDKGEKLTLFPFQKEIIKLIQNNDITLIAKSRQMFMSTLIAYYTVFKLLRAIKDKNLYTVLVISSKMEQSVIFLKICRNLLEKIFGSDYYKMMPINNRLEISFSVDRTLGIKCMSSSSEILLQSISFNDVIINEASYCKEAKDIINYLNKDRIRRRGDQVIAYSTLNHGEDDCFKKMFFDKKNNFAKFSAHYSLNPLYTKDRIDELKKILGPVSFNKEIEILEGLKIYSISEKENRDSFLNIRIEEELKNRLQTKLYQLSEKENRLIKVSEYIRNLIEIDLRS